MKKHPSISKEAAIVKVFGRQYSSRQDTLFRNELRLLNKELESFLVDLQSKYERQTHNYEQERLLVKAYLHRQQYKLFESAWRKLYKRATENALYHLQSELLEWYAHYRLQTEELSYTFFESLQHQLEAALIACEAHALESYRKLEVLHSYSEQNLYRISSGQYRPQRHASALQQTAPLPNDGLTRLLDYQVQSYLTEGGSHKVDLLEEAIAYAQTQKEQPYYDPLLTTKLQVALALEHFICKNSEQADAIYQQLLEEPERLEGLNKPGLYCNYLSNLINLEHYERAIVFYYKHEPLWKNCQIPLYRTQYLLCWAYLGISDIEKAHHALLASDLQDRPRYEEFYARTLLSMVYFLMDDVMMAERETYNLLQNHRYKSSMESTHCEHVRQLHQFYQLVQQSAGNKRQEGISCLLRDVEHWYKIHYIKASFLIHRWLTRQIQQQLS